MDSIVIAFPNEGNVYLRRFVRLSQQRKGPAKEMGIAPTSTDPTPAAQRKNGSHHISTLNEKALHADLKDWYALPGDGSEVVVDGFLVDIVRGDLLVEIQTRNFSSIKRKLARLVETHPVRLVYPIAQEKWIVRMGKDERVLGRRKSPKHGQYAHLFQELVSIPKLVTCENFTIEVLLIQEEEIRKHEEGRAWRRKGWVTHERRLLRVLERRLFTTAAELGALVLHGLPDTFTTSELATATSIPRWIAQKMAYCLREMGVIAQVGKRRNAILYSRAPGEPKRKSKPQRSPTG